MPSKVVEQVIAALKERYKGEGFEIPISMREEPARIVHPGLVEAVEPTIGTQALTAPPSPFEAMPQLPELPGMQGGSQPTEEASEDPMAALFGDEGPMI